MKSPFRNKEKMPLQDLAPIPTAPETEVRPAKQNLTPELLGDSFVAMQKRLEANVDEIETEIEAHKMQIGDLEKRLADRKKCIEAVQAGQKVLAPTVTEVKKEAAQ